MISVAYNDRFIKVYKSGEIVWYKEFYNFDMLMAALEEVRRLI